MKVCANLPNTNNICDQHKLCNKIEKHGVIPVTINDSNSTYSGYYIYMLKILQIHIDDVTYEDDIYIGYVEVKM